MRRESRGDKNVSLARNESTAENQQFWKRVEAAATEFERLPQWKQGSATKGGEVPRTAPAASEGAKSSKPES